MSQEIIQYKEVENFEEYDALEDIQRDAWKMPDRELVPKRLIYATKKSGGVVIGAYERTNLIGYCWGWVGKKEPFGTFIYSHHNAVRKKFQNKGIGYQLKLKQREWAINKGYSLINWTFDPLQSKNCYLNLHKLGARCNIYYENYWGEMHDALNKGLETDRFYCNWYLKDQQTLTHLEGKFQNYLNELNDKAKQIVITERDKGILTAVSINLNLNSDLLFVHIPENFSFLQHKSKSLLIHWRKTTRKVFLHYFKEGYTASDFVVNKKESYNDCYHVLKKL
ncbi:MAG: GNAT family N-acetyltransferase [Candidatus Heimdallarchaeaceae archaeon]